MEFTKFKPFKRENFFNYNSLSNFNIPELPVTPLSNINKLDKEEQDLLLEIIEYYSKTKLYTLDNLEHFTDLSFNNEYETKLNREIIPKLKLLFEKSLYDKHKDRIENSKSENDLENVLKQIFDEEKKIYLITVETKEKNKSLLLNPPCLKLDEIDSCIHNKIKLFSLKITDFECDRCSYLSLNGSDTNNLNETEKKEEKEKLEKYLTNKSCFHKTHKCNIGYIPYNELVLHGINEKTDRLFKKTERKIIEERLDNVCKSSSKHHGTMRCCDPRDDRLNNVIDYLPDSYKNNVKYISVNKTCNDINDISVCSNENIEDCDDTKEWINAEGYHYCKLLNVKDKLNNRSTFKESELVPDCYENRCNNYVKMIDVTNNNKDNSEIRTQHYYLIGAVKEDNVDYIKHYYNNNTERSVNDKLKYGYSGNTIFHTVAYNNSVLCAEYLLSTNYDYTLVNKDLNSVLHIACLKGNYNLINKLIKVGASIDCKNKYGDTALHSAVRSGSYNSVLIITENGGNSCITLKNKKGETPLHVAITTKKKNFKIVELLVYNGSDVHSINNMDDTILKSLSNETKTISTEEIRTFLQKIYYYKFDNDEYNNLLNTFPEIRPFKIDTEIEENLKKNYDNYSEKLNYKDLIRYEDDIRDDKLYVKKRTRTLKDKVPDKYYEQFSDIKNSGQKDKIYKNMIFTNTNLVLFLIVFVILFYFVR